jgi:hypothetical protein
LDTAPLAQIFLQPLQDFTLYRSAKLVPNSACSSILFNC